MEPGAGFDNPSRYSTTLFCGLFDNNKLGGKTLNEGVAFFYFLLFSLLGMHDF